MDPRKKSLTINTDRRGMGPTTGANGELKEEDGEPLSPAGRLFHRRQLNCYIISILGSGKTIDVDAVKAGLERTIVRHPRFSSILVSDKYRSKKLRWIRTNVEIDDHIVIPNLNMPQRTTALPSPTPDQLIEDYISSLSTTSLPLTRPLWDLHLINMRTTKAEAVAILRMHHSLGDGVSLMSLLLACTRKMSDPDSVPSLHLSQPRKDAKSYSNGVRLWRLMVWLWTVLMHAWNTLVDMVIFVATAAFLKDTETPIKGVEGVEFRQKRFLHKTLSLNDLKFIKNAFGCSVNDVLLGMTSAGLSRYLNRRYGDSTNGTKKENSLPANIRVRTTLLVNIRPTPGISEIAKMMEGDSSVMWGNWLGYVIVLIPLMMCEDPLDHVRKAIEIADRKRKSLDAVFTCITGWLVIKVLGIKVAAALCHRVLGNTTVSLSNIVGPVDEIGFCGHPATYLAPSVYGHPQAITIHFQSYMNKMEIVLAVDELTVPDPHQLLEDLASSVKLIKDAVVARLS